MIEVALYLLLLIGAFFGTIVGLVAFGIYVNSPEMRRKRTANKNFERMFPGNSDNVYRYCLDWRSRHATEIDNWNEYPEGF